MQVIRTLASNTLQEHDYIARGFKGLVLGGSAELVALDDLASELLGAGAVSVGLALVTDVTLLLLLLLGGSGAGVLVADEALHAVTGNLAGLSGQRLGVLFSCIR